MTNRTADRESIVRSEIEGNGFRVHVRGWGSIPINDLSLSNRLVNMLQHAYQAGRQDAFEDLRDLIGAGSRDY